MTSTPDPFTALGLPVRPDLSDEQVRAAWRQVATATHPDRPDGGDPAATPKPPPPTPRCALPGDARKLTQT
jgi:curved DNA-binding protein CbpA